jgi:hypothetical protein
MLYHHAASSAVTVLVMFSREIPKHDMEMKTVSTEREEVKKQTCIFTKQKYFLEAVVER